MSHCYPKPRRMSVVQLVLEAPNPRVIQELLGRKTLLQISSDPFVVSSCPLALSLLQSPVVMSSIAETHLYIPCSNIVWRHSVD